LAKEKLQHTFITNLESVDKGGSHIPGHSQWDLLLQDLYDLFHYKINVKGAETYCSESTATTIRAIRDKQ
jgi:hypothetical protein